MFNAKEMIGRQIQNNIRQGMQGDPLAMMWEMKRRGLTPQQAYEQFAKDPNFVQSTNIARQQHPNKTFREIAFENGYDLEGCYSGDLF